MLRRIKALKRHRNRALLEQSRPKRSPSVPDRQGDQCPRKPTRVMHCPHCRAVNEEAEERCVHCGRRLKGQAPGPFPIRTSATSSAATAPALDPFADVQPLATAQPAEIPNYQPSLFKDGTT